MIDAHGRFLDANQVAVERYGYARAELLRMGPADLAPPELRDQVRGVLKTGQEHPQQREWRHVTRDGRALAVELTSRPVRLEGRPCILVAVRDITQVRQTEIARQASEEFLRAMIGASPVALFSIDFDGTVLFWSESCEKTLGWTAAEVIGRKLPLAQGDKVAEFDALREQIRAGQYFHGKELVLQRKDGSRIVRDSRSAPLRDAPGQIVAIVSGDEDITSTNR